MAVEINATTRAQKKLRAGGFNEDQRMATVDAITEMQKPLYERLDNLQSEMKKGFEKVESDMKNLTDRFDLRFDNIEKRFLQLTLTLVGLILTSNIAMVWIVLRITRTVAVP